MSKTHSPVICAIFVLLPLIVAPVRAATYGGILFDQKQLRVTTDANGGGYTYDSSTYSFTDIDGDCGTIAYCARYKTGQPEEPGANYEVRAVAVDKNALIIGVSSPLYSAVGKTAGTTYTLNASKYIGATPVSFHTASPAKCIAITIAPASVFSLGTFYPKAYSGAAATPDLRSCSGGGAVVPPEPTPPPTTCTLSPAAIVLNHGNLTPDSVSGATVSTPLSVSCSSDAIYSLTLASGNSISLTSTLKSVLTVEGKALGVRLNAVVGNNQVMLTSTLSGSAQNAGSFNGSGVLILNIL